MGEKSFSVVNRRENECVALLPRTTDVEGVKLAIRSLRNQLKQFRDEQEVSVKFDEFIGRKRITLSVADEKGIEGITDVRAVWLRSGVTVATSIRELFQIERWLNQHSNEGKWIYLYFDGGNLSFHLEQHQQMAMEI